MTKKDEKQLEKIGTFGNAKIGELKPADYNPRKISKDELARLCDSIERNGYAEPLIVNSHPDRKNIIIGGHQRLKALEKLGWKKTDTIPVFFIPIADEQEERRLNIALNKISGEFDTKKLSAIFREFFEKGAEIIGSGFDEEEAKAISGKMNDALQKYKETPGQSDRLGNLAKNYILPPFTILDSRGGAWQDRKNVWKKRIGDLAATREGKLGSVESIMGAVNSGISIFDPVLSELVYAWFLPPNGKVLDPFAGDAAKSLVAAFQGNHYTGVDIRNDQLEEHRKTFEKWNLSDWAEFLHGDAAELDAVLPKGEKYDLVFTCPPYYDLEIYSDDEKDASGFGTYEEFLEFYEKVFTQAAARLNPNRFLVCVVGEIRDEKGNYRGFVKDNIAIFQKIGLNFYNEAIIVESGATAALRANNQMKKNRKLVKIHQNVLVFFNGDLDLAPSHKNVLVFYNGDPDTIKDEFKNLKDAE